MPSAVRASEPVVRLATPEDCVEISKRLRKEDVEEVFHAAEVTPEEAIALGFRTSSVTLVVELEGELIAIFGVGGHKGAVGYPWLLATDGLRRIRKSFLRHCGGFLGLFLKEYRFLENYAWARNTEHLRWLRWLGFTVEPAVPFGPHGELFHRFTMRDKSCAFHLPLQGCCCP